LVLEGGGVKGIALAGAVEVLGDAGWSFPRVAGTSAGAIAAAVIAALNAAGQPLSRIGEILHTLDHSRFVTNSGLAGHLGDLGAAEHLITTGGLYDGHYLAEWLGGVLTELGPTRFGDLRLEDPGADVNLTPNQKYTLVVHTSDITRRRLVRLPWDYPAYGTADIDNQPIVAAVRASMSIPFFFQPVRLKAPAAVFDATTYEPGSVTWVDGGLLSNFPVEVFDRTDGAPSRRPTIGIKLSARATVVRAGPKIIGPAGEALGCLFTLLDNADRYYLDPTKQARTIFIDTTGVSGADFNLSTDQQNHLQEAGRTAANEWLQARRPV
jgi:NTE family protein